MLSFIVVAKLFVVIGNAEGSHYNIVLLCSNNAIYY